MTESWSPVQFERTDGNAPIVLVCEHASHVAPSDFDELGLSDVARKSHAAWDIGALDVARQLSLKLDAPLVSCGVTRILYDCNRPLTAPDCIPAKSELFDVPGNLNLTDAQRRMRYELIHEPFHAAVNGLIAAQQAKTDVPVTIVTIHTFTPIYNGKRRDVEIGFLHHDMPELSNAVQGVENSRAVYCTALNEPYNAADGVTYSLAKHADEKQLHSTMVEIRNDLVDTGEKARTVADHLAETLRQSIAQITSKAMQAAL